MAAKRRCLSILYLVGLWALSGLPVSAETRGSRIFVSSQPAGAVVFIDRQHQGYTTPTAIKITVEEQKQEIEIALKLAGYHIKILKVELNAQPVIELGAIALDAIKSQVGATPTQSSASSTNQVDPNLIDTDLEQTKKLLLQAIAIEPSANTYYYLGLIYGTQLQWQKAIVNLNQAIALNPTYTQAFSKLGEGYLVGLAQAKTAIPFLERAIQIDDQHIASYRLLGTAYLHLHQHEQAIYHLTTAVNLESADVESQYLLGFSYYQQGQFLAAIPCFEKVIQQDPFHIKAYFNLGNCYFRSGQMELAQTALSRFQELNQEQQQIQILNHYLLRDAQELQYSQSSEIAVNHKADLKKWDQLINLLLKYQLWSESIAALEQAQKVALKQQDPKQVGYSQLLGSVYLKTNAYPQAVLLYQELLTNDPTNAEYHHCLGQAHMMGKDYISAIDQFQLATYLQPDQPGDYLNLANAYRQTGNISEADVAWRAYQRLVR